MSINRYKNLNLINKRFIESFPNIKTTDLQRSDDYVIRLKPNQRLDQLAAKYLGDGTLWWAICLLNNFGTPFDNKIQAGMLIRIPKSVNNILNKIIS